MTLFMGSNPVVHSREKMSATVNILHRSTLNIFDNRFSKLKSLKHSSFAPFSSAKSLCCDSVTTARTMAEMVKTSAFRSDRTRNNAEEIEQEALMDGSPKLVASELEATLNRLSKWLLSGLFGVIIIWRHDSEALWAVMGSVLNALLSITLKQILNQERPAPALKSDPGMPSSHAQSIFFIFIFIILSIMECLGINEATLTISGLSLAFGSYLSWLRVSRQLHTISQVVVGAAVGSTFSILWFLSWNAFVLEAFNSNPWVQIIVMSGAVVFSIGFVLYVIQYWHNNE